MRSESSQSGPCSSSTTFLPAFASTDANTEPDAPAPTMTTSTFSLVISPPLFRWNVRHIGNAQRLIPFHGAVDDIDGIGAQHRVSQRPRLSGPAFELVLPHTIDEFALILCRQLHEFLAERLAAGVVDRHDRTPIELGEWRPEIEDAGLKQGFVCRHRQL